MRALSELPEVDHNMLSVIEKTRRSMKDEIRAEKGFRKRRRRKRKQEFALKTQEIIQNGPILTKLKELPRRQVKVREDKEKSEGSLEREICYKSRRKRGINFMQLIIIISLTQVTCCLVLSAQQHQSNHHQSNFSPIKVVQALQPTTKSRPTSKLKSSQFAETIERPAVVKVGLAEAKISKQQHNYEQPEATNLLTINKRHSREKSIEERILGPDNRPKRLRRSIIAPSIASPEPEPESEQILYDATGNSAESVAYFEREQLQLSDLGRRQQRDIEKTVGKQQTGNCSEFSELEPELGGEAAKIRQLLSRYYRVESSLVRNSPQITDGATTNQVYTSDINKVSSSSGSGNGKLELPRPSNVSVLIISWYPPILKLSWNLNELSEGDTSRLNFYENNPEIASSEQQGASSSSSPSSASSTFSSNHQDKDVLSKFDLELAIDNAAEVSATTTSNDPERRQNVTEGVDVDLGGDVSRVDADVELARELRRRRFLVRKSLTCFQITYNIINSRFKIIEEYPPYLRSIMLERLLPATEYSLHVVAVYLNRYRLFSERVQFVSPTDNESRRFKEGTYRPIHRYPDEPKRHLRYGLGQVRSEELTIVAIALLFWVATICLFFNKWGKIRMLEPYQPAYRESSTATFAVHHHPSIHNMQNCSPGSGSNGTGMTGSGALAGIGAKMSGLCGGTGAPIFETMPPLCPQAPVSQPTVIAPTANQVSSADICIGQQPQSKQDLVLPIIPTTQATKRVVPKGVSPNLPSSVAAQCPLDSAAIEQHQQHQSQQPQQRSFESTTQFGRRQSRGLLVRGRKRFETVGDEPLVPIKQRTNDELNYLFQTKAQALVRATALWSMKQQQKLRQQQLCARLAESEQQKQQDEFELLRRTSQVSSMIRQRHYSNQAQIGATGGGLITGVPPFCQTREAAQLVVGGVERPVDLKVKEREELEEYNKEESTTTAAAITTIVGRRDPRNQSLKYHRQSRAFDYTTTRSGATNSLDSQQHSGSRAQSDQEGGSGRNSWSRSGPARSEEVSSSNKLRRLMFLSKTHHHHHIATSISSSTLLNNASLGERGAGSGGETTNSCSNNERRFSTSQLVGGSSIKLNSLSVDSGSQNQAPSDDSKETHSENSTSKNDLSRHNRNRDQDFARDHFSSSLPSEVDDSQGQFGQSVSSLDSNKSAEKNSTVVAGLSQMKGPSSSLQPLDNNKNKQHSEHHIEHHILIEPPSPPYKQLVEGHESEGGEGYDSMAKSGKDPLLEREGGAEFDSGTGERMAEFTCLPAAQVSSDRGYICSKEPLEVSESRDTTNEDPPSWLKSDDKTQITCREIKPPKLITPETIMHTEGSESDKLAPEAWRQRGLVIEQKHTQQRQQQEQQPKRRASESASQIQIHIQTAKRRQKGSKQDLHCHSDCWPSTSSHTPLRGPLLTSARNFSQVSKQGQPKRPEICFQEASPAPFNKFIELRVREDRREEEGDDVGGEKGDGGEIDEVKNKENERKRLLNKQASNNNNGSDTDDAFVKLAEYTARKHSRNPHTHSLSHTSVQLSQNGDYLRHQSFCAGVGIGLAGFGGQTTETGSSSLVSPSNLQTYGGSTRAIHTNPQLTSPASASDRQHRLHLAAACSCGSGYVSNLEGQLRAPLLYETTDRDDMPDYCSSNHPASTCLTMAVDQQASARGRISSVFAGSPYSRAHRDSFAMLRALSQKKSKSAEDVAYLSSLVLQIWTRDRNPLLQSASQQQLSLSRRQSSSQDRGGAKQRRPKSSLNVSHF